MKITKRYIKQLYPNAYSVEQVDSKQLFEVYYLRGIVSYTLLISYKTIVGISIDSERPAYFYITTEKFSPTTSKQVNQFLNNHNGERISANTLKLSLVVHETN